MPDRCRRRHEGAIASIQQTELGRCGFLGPFLDVVSTTAEKKWYRSADLRLRLFMWDAADVHELLGEFLPDGQPSRMHQMRP